MKAEFEHCHGKCPFLSNGKKNEPGYDIGEHPRLRRACAYAQSRQSLRCSHTESMEVDEPSEQKRVSNPTR